METDPNQKIESSRSNSAQLESEGRDSLWFFKQREKTETEFRKNHLLFDRCPFRVLPDFEPGRLAAYDRQTASRFPGGNACFSPDGSKICYTASISPKTYYVTHILDSILKIYGLHTGKSHQPLKDFDSTAVPLRWSSTAVRDGPRSRFFPTASNEKYPIEQFVERGVIVLEPNYRGSSGYCN